MREEILSQADLAPQAETPRISFAVFQETWHREVPRIVREHELERLSVRQAHGLALD